MSKEEVIRENERIAIAKMAEAQARHEKAVYASASGMEPDGRKATLAAAAAKLRVNPDDLTVVHAGYLIKAPPSAGKKITMKGWKSRYFVLRKKSAVLEYYSNKEAFKKGANPKGVVDLSLCARPVTRSGGGDRGKNVSKKYSNMISLNSPRRGFQFSAPSVIEAMKWVKLITSVQDRIKSAGGLAPYGYGAAAPAPVIAGGGDAESSDEDDDEEDLPPAVEPYAAHSSHASPIASPKATPKGVNKPAGAALAGGVGGVAAAGAVAGATVSSAASVTPKTTAPEIAVYDPTATQPTAGTSASSRPAAATSPAAARAQPRAAAALPDGTFRGLPPLKIDRTHESKPWFFGPMDRNEADEVLREAVAEDGSGLFIVRSSERTGGFVMSWIGGVDGKVTHTQVLELPNETFKFKSKHGPPAQQTLTRLIECKEFVAMLRRADESFRKECDEDDVGPLPPTLAAAPAAVAAPPSGGRSRKESFYIAHTPRDKRRRRPTTAASDAAVQLRKMQKENERLRQELQAAREFLAAQSGNGGRDGGDMPPAPPASDFAEDGRSSMPSAPPPPQESSANTDTGFVEAKMYSQGSLRDKRYKSAGAHAKSAPAIGVTPDPLITAPLKEQDLVSQLLLQEELRKKLDDTYTRIRQNSMAGDYAADDEDI